MKNRERFGISQISASRRSRGLRAGDLRGKRKSWFVALGLAWLISSGGCSRAFYRLSADREAYRLISSGITDPAWQIPLRPVEPDPRSRMAMLTNPDCGPQPMDDPAAARRRRHPYRFENTYWDQIPLEDQVENPVWLESLPWNDSGQVVLTPELTMDLALLHNRQFQTRYEQVYLTALALTSNRFEFDTQWAAGVAADFEAAGDGSSRLLAVSDRIGLGRHLAAGGQFATSLLNSFVFEFGGGGFNQASGSIVATLTQPLLRGAFRHVRLESLTQAERELLYQVRDFARFRREFYLDITARYYGLLAQTQALRNLQVNLQSLELNLREHEELFQRKMVSQIQVDQVFQDYQSGRISLYSAEQALANSLDAFKFLLGLPAWVPLELDTSLLNSFEFTPREIVQLDAQVQELYMELLAFLPPQRPTVDELRLILTKYLAYRQQLQVLLPEAFEALNEWQSRVQHQLASTHDADERLDLQQQARLAEQLSQRLTELRESLADDRMDQTLKEAIDAYPDGEVDGDRQLDLEGSGERARDPWRLLLTAVGRQLREEVGELFIAQTQIQLFALEVESLEIDQEKAVQLALSQRLDLMNRRAQMADAFRRVEVAANALQSQLDVNALAQLRTDPASNNAWRFDASASSYRLGIQFDGPLNRLNERNSYRSAQLAYQQSRREYMAAEDSIANAIRADLRDLRISRLNFQIARQQYVAATRQVDEAKFNLRTSNEANSNLTRDLLTALQGLLGAKNNIISNWVDYKIAKIRLFVDLELLYLDDQGKWINERENLDFLRSEESLSPAPDPGEDSPAATAFLTERPENHVPDSAHADKRETVFFESSDDVQAVVPAASMRGVGPHAPDHPPLSPDRLLHNPLRSK